MLDSMVHGNLILNEGPTKIGLLTEEMVTDSPNIARRKLLICTILGIIFLIFPVVLNVIDPVLAIALYNVRIALGSPIYKMLEKEMETIHISTYLFNITNPERFLSGEDYKLKLQEVGPFTYSERRINDELELYPDKGVMRYTPRTRVVFLPEESVADPRQLNVTVPNLSVLSITSMMSSYPWASLGVNLLTQRLNSKAMLSMPAEDYLWGYEDELFMLGNTVMPGWINFQKLGILDRLYDKKRRFRLEVGATSSDKFEIKTIDGLGGLKEWGYEEPLKRTVCNTLSGAYEGIVYPDNLSPEMPIRIYRNVLCRMLELDYTGMRTMEYGSQALVYKLSNRTFGNSQEKSCLCHDECYEGLSYITPCFYGLPLALSSAHFLHGDPRLFERIEGLTPDEAIHDGEFVIDSKIGASLSTSFALQLNVVMKDVKYYRKVSRFSKMVIPIAHFKIEQPAPTEELKSSLRMINVTGPIIVYCIQALSAFIGLSLLTYVTLSIFLSHFHRSRRMSMEFQMTVEEKPDLLNGEADFIR